MKPFSEEHKAKISKATKGRVAWSKGKHLTLEHRLKIGIGNKGKKVSRDTRLKLSQNQKAKWQDTNYRTKQHFSRIGLTSGMKGKHHSKETKLKISQAHGGRHPVCCIDCGKEIDRRAKRCLRCNNQSAEFRDKISLANKGKGHKGRLGQHNSAETNAKLKMFHTGLKASPEAKKKMSLSRMGEKNHFFGRHHTEETKEKLRLTSSALWQNDSFVSQWMKARNLRPNKAEQKLNDILQREFPNTYKYVGNGEFILGGRCPDFLNINGEKELIELYGDYWHREDDPQDRIEFFKQYGYKTLIIWEHEIEEAEATISRIKEWQSD